MNTNEDTSEARVAAAYRKAERTQSWVANKAGIAIGTFRRRINGGGSFTVPELARIAQALEIHPSELLPAEFRSNHTSNAA